MSVFIEAAEPRNTPYEGLTWTEGGQVLEVEDHAVAEELLRIEGFSEVHPDAVRGRHSRTGGDADKTGDEGGDEGGDPPAKTSRSRKTPVTE